MNPFKRKPKDPEIQAAYEKAYKEERITQATIKGKADAQAKANQKPFYQKLGGAATGLMKGITQPSRKKGRNLDDMMTFMIGDGFADGKQKRRRER